MGKYMRKGKGTGEVAVMEVSPGSLGVRTRAKTLALEQDRKLTSVRSGSLKQQKQQISCVVDPFQTCYLELRSRKLSKVVKEIDRPAREHLMREDGLNEDGRIVSNAEEAVSACEAECTARPVAAAMDLRIGSEELNVAVVGSLRRSPEHSPIRMDKSPVVKAFPIEPALSTPAALEDAYLKRLKPGPAEEPLKLGIVHADDGCGEGDVRMPVGGEWPVLGSVYSQDGVDCRRSEVETSYENGASTQGILSMRSRYFRGSPVSSSAKEREADEGPGSATRAVVGNRRDRRAANHHRIMNRRYMRTNLFNDAEAIDELFAAPDTTERVEGMRFTERYNYDVVNDLPLKGRYEWVAVEEPCTTTTTMQHLADRQQQGQQQHEVGSAFSFR